MQAALLCQSEKNAAILNKVMNYDLSKLERCVRRFHPQMDVESVLNQFRHFVYLVTVTGEFLPVPSRQLDELWHAAILYTRDYAEFCKEIAGRFIHHAPVDEPFTPEQIEQRQSKLTSLSIDHFGSLVFELCPDADCTSCFGTLADE